VLEKKILEMKTKNPKKERRQETGKKLVPRHLRRSGKAPKRKAVHVEKGAPNRGFRVRGQEATTQPGFNVAKALALNSS